MNRDILTCKLYDILRRVRKNGNESSAIEDASDEERCWLGKLCPGAPLFGFSGTFPAVFGGGKSSVPWFSPLCERHCHGRSHFMEYAVTGQSCIQG